MASSPRSELQEARETIARLQVVADEALHQKYLEVKAELKANNEAALALKGNLATAEFKQWRTQRDLPIMTATKAVAEAQRRVLEADICVLSADMECSTTSSRVLCLATEFISHLKLARAKVRDMTAAETLYAAKAELIELRASSAELSKSLTSVRLAASNAAKGEATAKTAAATSSELLRDAGERCSRLATELDTMRATHAAELANARATVVAAAPTMHSTSTSVLAAASSTVSAAGAGTEQQKVKKSRAPAKRKATKGLLGEPEEDAEGPAPSSMAAAPPAKRAKKLRKTSALDVSATSAGAPDDAVEHKAPTKTAGGKAKVRAIVDDADDAPMTVQVQVLPTEQGAATISGQGASAPQAAPAAVRAGRLSLPDVPPAPSSTVSSSTSTSGRHLLGYLPGNTMHPLPPSVPAWKPPAAGMGAQGGGDTGSVGSSLSARGFVMPKLKVMQK